MCGMAAAGGQQGQLKPWPTLRSALLVEEPLLTLAGLLLLRLLAVRNIGVGPGPGFVGVLSAGFVFLRSSPSIANPVSAELLQATPGRLKELPYAALFGANRGRLLLGARSVEVYCRLEPGATLGPACPPLMLGLQPPPAVPRVMGCTTWQLLVQSDSSIWIWYRVMQRFIFFTIQAGCSFHSQTGKHLPAVCLQRCTSKASRTGRAG